MKDKSKDEDSNAVSPIPEVNEGESSAEKISPTVEVVSKDGTSSAEKEVKSGTRKDATMDNASSLEAKPDSNS